MVTVERKSNTVMESINMDKKAESNMKNNQNGNSAVINQFGYLQA